MTQTNTKRWKEALSEIWHLNRVHVSTEMSSAYRFLKKHYKKIKIFGYKSGKEHNGWIIPPGWNVKHAILKNPNGKIIANWAKNKLCLWTYSPSFKGKIKKEKLLKKIFSNPKKPNDTMFHFRNQYNFWNSKWGFSLPFKIVKNLKKGNYEVDIKTSFFKGKLEMAEQVHNGKYKDSILFVGHFDHPQMCLDGLVGCLAGHEVISRMTNSKTNLTYRMLSTVEIVGSVFYAKHKAKHNKVREALFIAAPGARANLNYQQSFSSNSTIDKITKHCIKYFDNKSKIWPFRKGPLGNDEIAYDVGGTGIPCGSLIRAPFDSYHTDRDVPKGVSTSRFEKTLKLIQEIIYVLEKNSILKRKFSGLPRLSSKKYNLYLSPVKVSGVNQSLEKEKNKLTKNFPEEIAEYTNKNTHKFNHLMNTLPNMCEGDKSILDVAEFVGLPFRLVESYVNMWVEKKLIKKNWIHPFK